MASSSDGRILTTVSLTIAGALTATAVLMGVLPAGAGELHQAAQNGDIAAIATLLKSGADVNQTDGEGETALHKAVKANRTEIVSALLAARADPYISGRGPFGSTGTPLHLAAKSGGIDSLRVLLDAGIDPNLADDGVGPPLHIALYYHRTEAADLLRSRGAGPVVATPIGALVKTADAKKGASIATTCKLCHHLAATPPQRRLSGPPLWDIVGRPKAGVATFAYSDALRAAGGAWTYDDLNSFLANPRGYVPGTKMVGVIGINAPERRADLIRYLRSLSAAPAPLPD